jgi:hypothetical protein
MKKLAYVTHDCVNESFVAGRLEQRDTTFSPLTLRDAVAGGEFDRILLDWDFLDPEGREALLARLLAGAERGTLGLHSYGLVEEDAADLRGKGVAVFERLDPDALAWLRDPSDLGASRPLADASPQRPPCRRGGVASGVAAGYNA